MRKAFDAHAASSELVQLFERHLGLCKVRTGERVLVFGDSSSNPAYMSAALAASRLLGAEATELHIPSGQRLVSPVNAGAWQSADLVIGMAATVPWLYSEAHNQALETGVRTLMIEEPEDILRRLFPSPEVRRRTLAGQQLMSAGTQIRVQSSAGTDLIMDKGDRPAVGQYGVSDVPGRWDHWPSGLVGAAPIETSAEGTLVIDQGDILLGLGRFVESPITCTLRGGRIVGIVGGADARLLADYIEAANDPNAYVVSHIGWGTDDRAVWTTVGQRFWEWGGIMDAESYYGNMQIAFGANFFRQFGGQTRSGFHLDVPTRNHSFWVDGVQVLDAGRFVLDSLV